MKKFLPFILISAFLFPALGHAESAPVVAIKSADATPSASQTATTTPIVVAVPDINAQLHTNLATLMDLSKRTQTAMDQLNLNNIDTTQAQTALDAATAAFTKAKITLNTPKYNVKTAQSQILEGKTDILLSLGLLKNSLQTLDQAGQ